MIVLLDVVLNQQSLGTSKTPMTALQLSESLHLLESYSNEVSGSALQEV